jgi:hypothetical protein
MHIPSRKLYALYLIIAFTPISTALGAPVGNKGIDDRSAYSEERPKESVRAALIRQRAERRASREASRAAHRSGVGWQTLGSVPGTRPQNLTASSQASAESKPAIKITPGYRNMHIGKETRRGGIITIEYGCVQNPEQEACRKGWNHRRAPVSHRSRDCQ